VAVARVKSVAIGGTVREDLDVVVMDVANVGAAMGVTLDGIIGYTFLKDLRVVIDYPARSVRFERPVQK
jgi:hypothetical protein